MKERSEYLKANISPSAGINNDFRPLMFFAQMNYWMSYFNRHYLTAIILLLLVILVALLNLNPVNTGLFTGGFTTGAFQVLILLSLQIFCGYVFQLTGFIIMLFMLGLAMGSLAGARWFRNDAFRAYLSVQLILAALSVLVPMAMILAGRMGLPLLIIQAKAAAITIVFSFLAGMEYSLAFRLSERNKALAVSKNYSADLFGAALGAFIVPVLLFPLLGLLNTGYVLALLNTAGAATLFIRRRNFVSL
jgi:predicted membrane-bound spermidine synthase